ncbi:MAG: hypothetical protein ABIP44_06115 [Pseudoxanthomonas sp.]
MPSSKNLLLLALLLLGFLSGIARQLIAPGQPLSAVDVAFMLLGLLFVFAWYRLDSDEQGYRRSVILNIAVIAITILALPYYLFRSRGFFRGLLGTVLFIATAIAYSALQVSGEYVAYHMWQS